MTPHQATCVAIRGRGLLIEGPAGSGKSSLALALIDRGAVLVGDDSLMLTARDGRLFAHPHPRTEGLLEVRNVGLLPFPVCSEVHVNLLVMLDDAAPRYIEVAERRHHLDCTVPMLRLWPHSPVLALRAEQSLARYGN